MKRLKAAIINHLGMSYVDGREHTAAFIKNVVSWWNVLNVKSIREDLRCNNTLQTVVQDSLDKRLRTILQFEKMALQMTFG